MFWVAYVYPNVPPVRAESPQYDKAASLHITFPVASRHVLMLSDWTDI